MPARSFLKVTVLAVLAVAGIGCTSATPAEPSPTPVPTSGSGVAECVEPRTEPGLYWLHPKVTELAVPITIQIPAGWNGCGLLFKDAAGGLMLVGTWRVGFVYPDPCHWKSTLAAHPDPGSATDVAQAFVDQGPTNAAGPDETSIDGHAALHVRLSVPADADITNCDIDQVAEFRFMQGAGDSVWWLEASDVRELVADVWILDFEGTPYVIQSVHWPGNSEQDVSEQAAMVESITFED